jgi:putative FmdB family regulatory protein
MTGFKPTSDFNHRREIIMPIYSFRCSQCGHAQDHLMKMSDAAPACPACAGLSYAKQITSAAFALKGNGYYATDFKNGSPASPPATPKDTPAGSAGCSGGCACHP